MLAGFIEGPDDRTGLHRCTGNSRYPSVQLDDVCGRGKRTVSLFLVADLTGQREVVRAAVPQLWGILAHRIRSRDHGAKRF